MLTDLKVGDVISHREMIDVFIFIVEEQPGNKFYAVDFFTYEDEYGKTKLKVRQDTPYLIDFDYVKPRFIFEYSYIFFVLK